MINGCENFFLHLSEGAADSGTCGHGVAATAKLRTYVAGVEAFVLGAKAHADPVFREFFEESGGDDTLNRADMIDEALVVLREYAGVARTWPA